MADFMERFSLTQKKTFVRLRKLGATESVAYDLASEGFSTPAKFRIFADAVKKLGAQNAGVLVSTYLDAAWARKQKADQKQAILRGSRKPMTVAEFLQHFVPITHRLLNDRALKAKGYRLHLSNDPDAPMLVQVEIMQKERCVASMNIDFFLLRGKKPGVIIANRQGRGKEIVEQFRERMGVSPLDYFMQRFAQVFPSMYQRRVLDPRKHYPSNPNSEIILDQLKERGVISHEEYLAFKGHAHPELHASAKAKLDAELKAIKTRNMGAHLAAYKKAGYLKQKRRFWKPASPRKRR